MMAIALLRVAVGEFCLFVAGVFCLLAVACNGGDDGDDETGDDEDGGAVLVCVCVGVGIAVAGTPEECWLEPGLFCQECCC